MSQSSLVKYTRLSPNKTSPRNHKIDTLTIHCVSGNCTIETLGEIFAPSSRQASSHYGIGTDGRIGQYCLEENRSWCTSNATNDHRAITIEVANDGGAPDWHVSDKAIESLISLLVDICKRNGIPKLLWRADKNLIGQITVQNMTVHRWFANKSCPGDYLYSKHYYIANEVNKRLGISSTPPSPTTGNNEFIWNYFKSKGFTDAGAAGVLGNISVESGLEPKRLQNDFTEGYIKSQDYTTKVDTGLIDKETFIRDAKGYGLVQWTFWSRKESLFNFAKQSNTSIGDLNMQLNFIWKELESGYAGLIKILRETKSVSEASNAMMLKYERPLDQSIDAQTKRIEFSQKYYDMFVNKTIIPSTPVVPTPTPIKPVFKEYKIKVTDPSLNIRKGPGTNYAITGIIKNQGIYTIVEESNNNGTIWLKLKSGVGYISSKYTKKI